LAQKLVGFACGLSFGEGVLPGSYCEPHVSTVGSQDTTGSMTRDELKDIACLKFNADFVMQSFCHTAAYPNESDILMQQTLPSFFTSRGGVALSVGDGVIHSWLNRFALPNTLGTGADSHTRFPIGISFPGGSGLVAFAAATGTMPLSMPESVLVRFKGKMNPNITLRDLVNAIPYYAIKKGLLTLDKKNKKNIFSGRILEIQGLESLKAEQAFELADASAERSAAACTVALDKEPVIEYIKSNIALLENMIKEGYKDSQTLRKRIEKMKDWLKNPVLLKADDNGEYKAIIEIDIAEITEPLLACPNDPDDIKTLSQVAKTIINEAFIGSCMINIGHFRAAGRILENKKDLKTQLWVAPPTRMDANRLREEGIYSIFGKSGARIEMAGCSLCMGNQAQVKEGATVISTSTRNFPNRLGLNTKVFLGSAELAAISAKLGYLPTLEEYKEYMKPVVENEKEIYRYLQFDEEKEDFLKK
jgi:aconitate hydratase 2/2-methylisocitrate dehydratase